MPKFLRTLLTGRTRYLVLFFAGTLLSLALPPLGWFWVPFLTLPIAVLSLDVVADDNVSRKCRLWRAALLGWSFGFGYFVISLYWIGAALLVEAEKFAILLPFAVIALPAGLALFWAFAFATASAFWQSGWGRIVLLAVALSVFEWLRGHVLTGFPWNLVGTTSLHMGPLAQTGSVVGVYGLTFLVFLFGSSTALLLGPTNDRRAFIGFGSVAIGVAIVAMVGRQDLLQPDNTRPVVRIVQPNIAQKTKWQRQHRHAHITKTLGLVASKDLENVSLIVLPESALPLLYERSPDAQAAIASLLSGSQKLIMGGIRLVNPAQRPRKLANSVLAVGLNGVVTARQAKRRLVPFGEYLPFKPIFNKLGIRKLVPIPDGFVPGDKVNLLKTGTGGNALALICYEIIFPFSGRSMPERPDWIINVTNDAWFGNTAGPHQHLAMARMRAIETGLPVVRAANTGISAVIDTSGTVISTIPLNTSSFSDQSLPRAANPTIYWRFGDWTFVCILIISVLMIALSRRLIRVS